VPQSFVKNLALQVLVLLRYLRLFVLPWGQSLVQPFREVDASTAPLSVAAGLLLVGMIAAAATLRRRAPMVSFGAAWFFLCMAPSTLVPLAEPMSEHRVYVAAIGLCLLAPTPLLLLRAWSAARPPALVLVPGAALLAVLGGLSVARHHVWSSERALWTEAAERAPTVWVAQYGAALALKEAGDCKAAEAPYRAALRLGPEEVRAHHGLAECLARLGRPAEAFEVLDAAARARPGDATTLANLGALALSVGAPRRGLAFLREAVAREPQDAERRARSEELARWIDAHPDASERPWPPKQP
jgi:tetratricopeptide (TPR) repeat protein